MKKSLADAMAQAQQISANNPGVTVWAMDKPKHKAVVVCFDWVRKERILDGYVTVAVFRNGKEAAKG